MDEFTRAMAKIEALKQMPDNWPNKRKDGEPMAKQFKDAAAAARPVYSTIIGSAPQEQDAHKEQDTQQEQPRTAEQDLKEALATRGHKGVKLPRINLAFRPSLLDYLRVMAAIQGVSITQYVNNLVAKDMETNADTYAQALRLTGKDL